MSTYWNVYQDGVDVRDEPSLSAYITGLTAGQQYSFRVSKVVDGVEGPLSNTLVLTPTGTTGGDPGGGAGTPGGLGEPGGGPGGPGDPGFTTLQAAINAAAPGSTITCPVNTVFPEFVAVPSGKNGITIELNGSQIDAQNVRKQWMTINSDNVRIQNGGMKNAKRGDGLPAGDFQLGSLQGLGVDGLVLYNLHLTGGTADNFGMQGPSSGLTISHCEIDNARVTGVSVGKVSDVLVEYCHIHHNNPQRLGDPGNEAGGLKIGNFATNLQILRNEVDHNIGPQIWVDVEGQSANIQYNRVHHGDGPGIHFEVSGYTGDTGTLAAMSYIQDNVVWECGWATPGLSPNTVDWTQGSILISSAARVTVRRNITAWGRHGFVGYAAHRLIGPANTHNFDFQDVHIEDNIFILGPRTTAGNEYPALMWMGQESFSPPGTMYGATNDGARNKMWAYLPNGTYGLLQTNQDGVPRTMDQWNATQWGGGSSLMTIAERDAALTAAGIPLTYEAH